MGVYFWTNLKTILLILAKLKNIVYFTFHNLLINFRTEMFVSSSREKPIMDEVFVLIDNRISFSLRGVGQLH